MTNSELISSVASSFDIETYLPPLELLARFALPLRGELGLFENEARGTGLVKPMLLLPPPLPPDDTVMVTGDEDGDEALLTIFVQKSTKRLSDLKMKEKSLQDSNDTGKS